MNSVSSIARSGLEAAQTRLQASAHNVANLLTPGFAPQVVHQTTRFSGGVSSLVEHSTPSTQRLEDDVVAQLQAKNSFLANLEIFKTQNAMLGSLLDTNA